MCVVVCWKIKLHIIVASAKQCCQLCVYVNLFGKTATKFIMHCDSCKNAFIPDSMNFGQFGWHRHYWLVFWLVSFICWTVKQNWPQDPIFYGNTNWVLKRKALTQCEALTRYCWKIFYRLTLLNTIWHVCKECQEYFRIPM